MRTLKLVGCVLVALVCLLVVHELGWCPALTGRLLP